MRLSILLICATELATVGWSQERPGPTSESQPGTAADLPPVETAFARAQQLHRQGQDDQARALLVQQLAAGRWEMDWFQDERFNYWFAGVDAAEQLVRTFEGLPREIRLIREGQFWLGDVCRLLEYARADRVSVHERRVHELALRAYRTADDFSRIAGASELDTFGRSRPFLNDQSRALIRDGEYEAAYELLCKAVLGDSTSPLPEADMNTLFYMYVWDKDPPYYPVTQLVWLAGHLDRLADLRRAVEARRARDPDWDAIGLRLLALIDIERGADEAAAKELGEIAAGPMPTTREGSDPSLDVLAECAAGRPALLPAATALLNRLFEQSGSVLAMEGSDVMYLLDLARLYLLGGNLEAAKPVLERAARATLRRGEDSVLDSTVVLAETAALYDDCGYPREALAAYRELLQRPFVPQEQVTEFSAGKSRAPRVPTDEARRILEQLRDGNQLDGLLTEARAAWEERRDAPPTERNCEPLVFLAACQMLCGAYADADAALAQLDESDYPASLALVLECLAASPDPGRGLATIDGAFVRWPCLFRAEAVDLTALYANAKRPLPTGAWLAVHVDKLSGDAAVTLARPAGPAPRGGHSPSARPTTEVERRSMLELLQRMARTHFSYCGADEQYATIAEVLARHLGCDEFAYPWLAWQVERDPSKVYATVCEFLGLASPDDPLHALVPLTLQRVFEEQGEPTRLAFDPYQSRDCETPAKTLALVIVEAARRAGKLAEFTTACEQAVQAGAARDATPAARIRRPLAARLYLHALTLQDPARVKELLPGYLAGSDPFGDVQPGDAPSPADPALTAIREACWAVPELRAQALQIGDRQLAIEWQRGENLSDEAQYSSPWPNAGLCYRVAEMRFLAGQREDAVQLLGELRRRTVTHYSQEISVRAGDLTRQRPNRLLRLARRYHVEAEVLELLQADRAVLAAHPRVCRQLELAENELRQALGQDVAPGIVLAVQPARPGYLEFVWQINRSTLPVPAEGLMEEPWSDLRAPLRGALHVVFSPPERAVPIAGFKVRFEQSADGSSYTPLRTIQPSDAGPSVGGAYRSESSVEPNVLRWYRARLLRADEVVATSNPVAAISGENLLPSGEFQADVALNGQAPAGWRYRRGDAGQVEILGLARPGRGSFGTLCSVRRHQEGIVHSRQNVPIRADASYVLCGWAIALPAQPGDRGAEGMPPAELPHDLRGKLWLSFRDTHNAHLVWKSLAFEQTGTAIFAEVVLRPDDGCPVGPSRNWLSGFDGDADAEGIVLPARAQAIELWARPYRSTGMGDLCLTGTVALSSQP